MKAEKLAGNTSHKHDKVSTASGLGNCLAPLDDGGNPNNFPQDDQLYEDGSVLFYDDGDDDESGEDGGLDLDEWMNKWATE